MTIPGPGLFPGATVFPSSTSRDLTLTAVLEAATATFTAALTPNRYSVALEAGMAREIPLSLGAAEYVTVVVTEASGADITGSTLQMSLGSYSAPGTWLTPDQITNPSSSTARVSLLVGASYLPTAGKKWPWVRVNDSPEVTPIRCNSSVTIS